MSYDDPLLYGCQGYVDMTPKKPAKPKNIMISLETAKLALSAIRASQERDYYHNFAEAQRELERKL